MLNGACRRAKAFPGMKRGPSIKAHHTRALLDNTTPPYAHHAYAHHCSRASTPLPPPAARKPPLPSQPPHRPFPSPSPPTQSPPSWFRALLLLPRPWLPAPRMLLLLLPNAGALLLPYAVSSIWHTAPRWRRSPFGQLGHWAPAGWLASSEHPQCTCPGHHAAPGCLLQTLQRRWRSLL